MKKTGWPPFALKTAGDLPYFSTRYFAFSSVSSALKVPCKCAHVTDGMRFGMEPQTSKAK